MGDLTGAGRLLIAVGLVLTVVGVVLVIAGRYVGRLPGDLVFRRDETSVLAPVVTMIVVSVTLTVILNLVIRLFRRE